MTDNDSIAILGTGAVGRALASRMALAGIAFHFGSRNPANARARLGSTLQNGLVLPIADAVSRSSMCFIAVPWRAVSETLHQAADWSAKILVDCTNPLNHRLDGLAVPCDDSAAEQIARQAKGAFVVKALNTLGASVMEQPACHGQPATAFYCGDDANANAKVGELLKQLGFDPVDAGPLGSARILSRQPCCSFCWR